MAAPNANLEPSSTQLDNYVEFETANSDGYLAPNMYNSGETDYSYATAPIPATPPERKPATPPEQSGVESPPPYTMDSPPVYQALVSSGKQHRYQQAAATPEYEGPYTAAYEEIELNRAPAPPASKQPGRADLLGLQQQIQAVASSNTRPNTVQGGNIIVQCATQGDVINTTNHIVYQQPTDIRTWLPWSIIALILFIPLGIPATILSVMAIADKKNGRLEQAKRKATASLVLDIISTVIFGIIVLPITCILACCAAVLATSRT